MSELQERPESRPPNTWWPSNRCLLVPLGVAFGLLISPLIAFGITTNASRNALEDEYLAAGFSVDESSCVADEVDSQVNLLKDERNAGDAKVMFAAMVTCVGFGEPFVGCVVRGLAGVTEGLDADQLIAMSTVATDADAAALLRAVMRCDGVDLTVDQASCIVGTVRDRVPDAFTGGATMEEQLAIQHASMECSAG